METKEHLEALLAQLEATTQELDETQLQTFQQLALEAPISSLQALAALVS